ncbi:MAG: DNA polymerase III subunit epsilon [Hyphomicrobiales bacterium]|nr:DNA polymerase III subunit epsilon [Hyphomicrobiales bacterium]
MREIVLDTETTGLDPDSGDRIVEIACIEMMHRIPTGRVWHHYINPERDMPAGAFAVHGLSSEFLADKPKFAELADDFVRFIDGAQLVIHNAAFDVKFLNAELARVNAAIIDAGRVVDTLALARRKHAGAQNNLDALCRRYGVDNTRRTKHGALLDTELLAEVYLNLIGAHQPGLDLGRAAAAAGSAQIVAAAPRPGRLPQRVTEDEIAAHQAFLATLKAEPIWRVFA